MSDEHDELKRQAAALREIMNKPFEPSGYDRKRQGNGAKGNGLKRKTGRLPPCRSKSQKENEHAAQIDRTTPG